MVRSCLVGPFVRLEENSMTVDMKKSCYDQPGSIRVWCGKQKGIQRRESLQGLEGGAVGQAGENDFRAPRNNWPRAATPASVRKVAVRQEDTMVAVFRGLAVVLAVAIITVEVWSLASGYGCDSFFLLPMN